MLKDLQPNQTSIPRTASAPSLRPGTGAREIVAAHNWALLTDPAIIDAAVAAVLTLHAKEVRVRPATPVTSGVLFVCPNVCTLCAGVVLRVNQRW
jgi:hypothetical protein